MKVTYANRTLERSFHSLKRAKRSWRTAGVAEAYVARIPVLMAIDQLEDLYQFPDFGFHRLRGDRRSQYAITLAGSWRLIFEYHVDEDELFIVEVTDYHD